MSAIRDAVRLSLIVAPLACGCSDRTSLQSALDPPIGLMRAADLHVGPRANDQALLGRELFFDRRLSRDSSTSCADCHIPWKAFAEPYARSQGLGPDARRRNTPTLINVGLQRQFGWDGSATSLAEQLHSVFSPLGDMGLDIGHAVENVDSERRYVRLFRKAFGGAPNVDSFMAAIVAFQLSLVTADSPFDRYFFEADSTALSTSELRGYKLFTEAGCAGCHVPVHPDKNGLGAALFTDFRFHNLGIGYSNGRMSDVGRYAITQDPKDWGSFKTPSLRNVALTGPYMHDGSLATLSEVVRHYVEGGIPNPNLDPAIELLVLSEQDQRDIVSFLNALTSAQLLDTARMRSEWRKFAKSF